jgi:hypothetical protein
MSKKLDLSPEELREHRIRLARIRHKRYYEKKKQDPEFREYKAKITAQYRKDYPEKAREQKKKYRAKINAEQRKKDVERSLAWRRKNREKFIQQRRLYRERNRDRLNTTARERHVEKYPDRRINFIVRELRSGRLDGLSAVTQIREHFNRIDGEISKLGQRVLSDGDSRSGEGSSTDGTGTSQSS